jgi:hypothetical protein
MTTHHASYSVGRASVQHPAAEQRDEKKKKKCSRKRRNREAGREGAEQLDTIKFH